MAKKNNKDKSLTNQYIRAIENPDSIGFRNGRWYQSTRGGDDPNSRGFGIDIKYNKEASELAKDRNGKYLTEDEERNLRDRHVDYVTGILDKNTPSVAEYPSEIKQAMAKGLLYRGDGVKTILNNPSLQEAYLHGTDDDFEKAVADYYTDKGLGERARLHTDFVDSHKPVEERKINLLQPSYTLPSYSNDKSTSYGNTLPEVEVVAKYPHEQRVIDTMNASNAEFMQRLRNNDLRMMYSPTGSPSTHIMVSEDNYAFPLIQDRHGHLEDIRQYVPKNEWLANSIENNDAIKFQTEGDARYFGEHYKKYFPEFFSHFGNNQYAKGGELEKPKHWKGLSMADKSDVMAAAVRNGVTTLEEIRKAWDDYADDYIDDSSYREDSGYRDYSDNRDYSDYRDDSKDSDYSEDRDNVSYDDHQYLKGGYKPSASIKNRIANWEGSGMATNRSFEAEAKDFWNAIPSEVRNKLSQQQADALYSYSYNVGAGNFKRRVVPSLERYFNGDGSVDDVQRHMYATQDSKLRGLAKRRAVERAMFAGQKVGDVPAFNYDYTAKSTSYSPLNFSINNNVQTTGYLGPVINNNSINRTKQLMSVFDEEPKQQVIVDDTPEPVYNTLERLQNMYSMLGMDDYAQEIGKYNPFAGLTFAEGGKKATVYKTTDGNYTTANGHPVEQIGWDDNGYARYRDIVTGDLGKAYKPTDDYGVVTNRLTPKQKADMFLKNYTLAQAVRENQTASNDNLWIENGREKNSNLNYKGIVGGRANAAWEQEHPALTKWGYVPSLVTLGVASYPLIAGGSDTAMATSAGQTISGPLVDMATAVSRSKWMPWADAVTTSIFGADAMNDIRNSNVTPETVLELAPLTRAGKGIAQEAAKIVQKNKSLSFNLPISYSNDNLKSIGDILNDKFNFSTDQANTINSKISKYANSKRNPIEQIRERMSDPDYAAIISSNSDPLLSSKEGVVYFENINPLNPDTYDNALRQTENWWKTHNTPYSNLPMTEAIKHEIQLNNLPIAAAPSPFVYMQDLRSLYKRPMFSKYPDTSEKMAHQYNILKGHETAHILATPNENSPLAKILDKDDYFVKNGGTEISARGTQLKNYFDKKTISKDELKYASEHYVDDTGVDNDMTSMFSIIKKAAINNPNIWKEVAEWMTKHSPILVAPLLINNKKN